ncbi:MAG: HesA/MoeB/ThiF family protein, partial [Candidatus Aenigmarchaeota archaeon]|nr:HesA/MoeB/ThiF family protein [Candidatus Aenigmarchaeota archaeon]
MNDRYSRQIATGKITLSDQKILIKKRVAIVGAGAIGSNMAVFLLRAGILNLTIIDRDFVEVSNLHRQYYTKKDVGKTKTDALKTHLKEIDGSSKITAYAKDMDVDTIELLENHDLVIDATDNMETRFLLNDFCMKNKIPWIYLAAIGTTATAMNILPEKTACFECVFGKETPAGALDTCETAGILNSTILQITAHASVETIKMFMGKTPALGIY